MKEPQLEIGKPLPPPKSGGKSPLNFKMAAANAAGFPSVKGRRYERNVALFGTSATAESALLLQQQQKQQLKLRQQKRWRNMTQQIVSSSPQQWNNLNSDLKRKSSDQFPNIIAGLKKAQSDQLQVLKSVKNEGMNYFLSKSGSVTKLNKTPNNKVMSDQNGEAGEHLIQTKDENGEQAKSATKLTNSVGSSSTPSSNSPPGFIVHKGRKIVRKKKRKCVKCKSEICSFTCLKVFIVFR